MGEAFITRRGGSGGTINFNNTFLYQKGTAPSLPMAKQGTVVIPSKYGILAAGGFTRSNNYDYSVRYYNKNMEVKILETLTYPRKYSAGALAGDVAVISCGYSSSAGAKTEGYNMRTGTKVFEGVITYARYFAAGASAGEKALFIGGCDSTGRIFARVDAVTSTGELSTANLSQSRSRIGAGTLDGKAFAAGGESGGVYYDNVDMITDDLNITAAQPLSSPRSQVGVAVMPGKFIFFFGGRDSNGFSNKIDIYNFDGERVKTIQFSTPTTLMFGLSFDNFVVLAGGDIKTSTGGSTATNKAYVIDESLTIIATITLDVAKYGCSTGTIDEKGVIFGGATDSSDCADVEVIEVAKQLLLLPGMKYKLGDMANEQTVASSTIYPITKALTGYIKVPNIAV